MADMLPPAVTNALVRLTIETTTQGVKCQTTHDYMDAVPSAPSLSDLQNFIAAWKSACQVAYLACLSPLSAITAYLAAELHFQTTPTAIDSPVAALGTAGATNLPLEMGATVSRFTNLKGKHGRGRFTMPAVPNTFTTPATDPNVLNATGLTAYTTLTGDLIFAIVVGPISWVPVVSVRPIAPITSVGFAGQIVGLTVKPTLGTARRRKPGRGI